MIREINTWLWGADILQLWLPDPQSVPEFLCRCQSVCDSELERALQLAVCVAHAPSWSLHCARGVPVGQEPEQWQWMDIIRTTQNLSLILYGLFCLCVCLWSLTASLSKASWKSRRRLSWYCLSWKIRFCRSTSFCCFICISCTVILFSCCVWRINRLTICSSRKTSCGNKIKA